MKIEKWYQHELPINYRTQLTELMQTAFDADPDFVAFPCYLLVDGATIVSHVLTPRAPLQLDGTTVEAVGISEVLTNEQYARQGYALQLLQYVFRDIQGADLSIFTCDEPLVSLYEKAGWQRVDGCLIGGTRQKPFRSDQFQKVTMAYPPIVKGEIFIELGERKLW